MNRIFYFFLVFLFISTIACNESKLNIDDSFVGLGSKYTLSSKAYSFGTINEICSSSTDCNAIIFLGSASSSNYVSIGVDDGSEFQLKLYFPHSGSEIPTGPGTYSNASIKIQNDGSYFSATGVDVQVNITDLGSGTYQINFTGNVTVGSTQIDIGDSITAVKY